jgi:hypothetical protein
VLFLVLIKNAVDNSGGLESVTINATFPTTSITPLSFADYITALRAQRVCIKITNNNNDDDGTFSAFSGTNEYDISGIFDDGFNWQVPFVKCDSRKCDDTIGTGGKAIQFCEFAIIAITGNNPDGQTRAKEFEQWIYKTYPSIDPNNPNKAILPFNFSFIQVFNSSTAIDNYVKSIDYGRSTMPKIGMGIVFENNDMQSYNYSLRQNSTNFNAPEDEGRPTAQTTPSTKTLFNSFVNNDFQSCIPINGAPIQGLFGSSCSGQYLYNGVLTIQRLVNDYIIDISGAKDAGYTIGEAGIQFTSFPTRAYEDTGFYAIIGGTFCFVCLVLLYCVFLLLLYSF